MCNFFATTDPVLYEARQRSVRINGVVTSVRLENVMWDVLAEMALHHGCTANELISKLHEDLLATCDGPSNFTSFLRVTCIHHLRRMDDAKPSAADTPVRASSSTPPARH